MARKRPNLLFIFSDEHRKFDLGCYGNSEVITPNLDSLAQNGVKFEHCISNSPVCVPARGSLLTGLCAQKHGAYTNDLAIRYDVESIADVLNQAGYHTGYIGKWHLCGVPRSQAIDRDRRLGFTEWNVANCNHNYLNCFYDDEENVRHPVSGYEPEIFGELACDFLRSNTTSNQPFALFLSFATPHVPHNLVGEEYLSMYADQEFSLRPNVADRILLRIGETAEKADVSAWLRGYYAHITAIDRQVGELLAILRDRGELENTLIVFTADHGTMLGSHGTIDKQLPYEESAGVPLIFSQIGTLPCGTREDLISLTDLPVTVAGLLGLQFTHETDGLDLSKTVYGCAPGPESCYLYDLYPCHLAYDKGMVAWRGIRTQQYTYAAVEHGQAWLLFDNSADPYQLHNLVDDPAYAAIQAELHQKLTAYVEQYDAFLTGSEYIRFSNRVEDFDESQACFQRPCLAELEKQEASHSTNPFR